MDSIREIETASCCKFKDARQSIVDFLDVEACRREVTHRVSSLAGAERGRRTEISREVNAELMRAVLRMRPNLELSVATTIESGLARARQRRPDVILLDMHLPDRSEYLRHFPFDIGARGVRLEDEVTVLQQFDDTTQHARQPGAVADLGQCVARERAERGGVGRLR